MAQLECPRCGYSTHRKNLFIGHINRKNICEPTVNDIALNDLQKLYLPKEKIFKCACGSSYIHHSSYYRHKITCEQNDTPAPASNTINITNIQTQNNINFYVLPHGEENNNYITPEFLTKCLRRTDAGIIDLLTHIHFNQEHKENQNLKISNKNTNFIEKFNGERWLFYDKKSVVDELFKTGFKILDDHYFTNEEELKKNLSKFILKNIEVFMKSLNDNDKNVIKPIFKNIYLLILNNSYMILTK